MNRLFLADALAWGARAFSGATLRLAQPGATLGAPSQQRVYVANHSSHLDFIVLWSALPPALRRVTRPVAAGDYWMKSAARRFLALEIYRAILIDRGHVSAHNNPIDLIAREMGRDSIIIFPEGTRGAGEEVAPFKSGVFHLLSKMPHLECVPVYIENLNRVLPKGEFLPLPLLSSLSVGAPVRLEAGEAKADFLRRLRQAVVDLKENPAAP
jgi:1-acyl-sn-glycerol-3-phosphate acyltransferase